MLLSYCIMMIERRLKRHYLLLILFFILDKAIGATLVSVTNDTPHKILFLAYLPRFYSHETPFLFKHRTFFMTKGRAFYQKTLHI
jgi:hypothetical protein